MPLEQRTQVLLHQRQLHDLGQRKFRADPESAAEPGTAPARASITSASCVAGSVRPTASSGDANCAPSMMSPHLINSASGLASNPNFSRCDVGQEFRAGLVRGIVELLARMIVPEMLGVLRLQERALMMVEPPGQGGRARIFEIHDRIFVAVERAVLKRRRRLVRHPGVEKFGARVDALAVKARKDRRGRGPVETLVVETDPNFQVALPLHAPPDRTSPESKVN